MLTVFYDMTADMEDNKKLSHIVSALFLKGRKPNISLVFISKFYLKVPKTVILNATHYFIMNILNKRLFQQTASNHLSNIEFKDFIKLYKDYFEKLFSHMVSDTILPPDIGRAYYKMTISKKIKIINNKKE